MILLGIHCVLVEDVFCKQHKRLTVTITEKLLNVGNNLIKKTQIFGPDLFPNC